MEPSEIEVHRLRITPQTSALESEVDLHMQFETPRHLRNCEWNVHVKARQYVVDTISRRKEVPLMKVRVEEYPPGRHQLDLHVPRIELEGLKLKKSHILTTGLLACKERNRSGDAGRYWTSTRSPYDDASL